MNTPFAGPLGPPSESMKKEQATSSLVLRRLNADNSAVYELSQQGHVVVNGVVCGSEADIRRVVERTVT